MKRIAIIVVMALMSLTASANSVRYFTHAQAHRTVQYLNAQQELMLYCGYDYEIETYVLINEVWMERVNSAYYEIWLYGYDAYTGDEVYMPLDLQCVWLYSAGRMYNAAQYLRFHATVHMPRFAWYVPPYHPYTRRMHRAGYMRSYHYDIHRHGWMPPAPPAHGWGPHTQPPLPPYYMRTPQQPAPAPIEHWTPGVDHPRVNVSESHSSGNTLPTTRNSGTVSGNNGTARSGNSSASSTSNTRNAGTTNSHNTGSTNTRESGMTTTTRSTSTTPTRSNTGVSSRSENSSTGTATRSENNNSRSTGTTTRSSNTSNNNTNTRSASTATNTRNAGTTTNSRSTETPTRGTTTNTGSTSRNTNSNRR